MLQRTSDFHSSSMMLEVETILYVADQARSKVFYEAVLGLTPTLDVPGMTEFELSPGVKLGLMPEAGIARILGESMPHPASGSGIPRCELYLRVDDPDAYFQRALLAGATVISGLSLRDWGDEVCYCADMDGHVLAFARRDD